MTFDELTAHVTGGETGEREFKRGLGDLSAIGRTLVALANSDGGHLFVGIADDGTLAPTPERSERVQERLTSLLQTGANAPVSAKIGRVDTPAGAIHWVYVPRQRGLEPLRAGGRVFVRHGRATVEPSASELQDLYNAFGYLVTEERYVLGASTSDIDVAIFRSYLTAQGLDLESSPQVALEDDLISRGVLTRIDSGVVPTLYGLLMFGREPQAPLVARNFWVECVAYKGLDRASEPYLVGEAKGRLDEQVDRAVGFVRGLGRFERYETIDRIDEPFVPDPALREAVVNAIAHRDYAITGSKVLVDVFSDRIEVTSPGSLPNHMTVAGVMRGGQPRSRNELIANALVVRRKMEQRGRGFPILRARMREFNGTEPLLEEDRPGRWVRVTLDGRRPPAYA